MPKKGRSKSGGQHDPLSLPTELQSALQALYGHYKETFEPWQEAEIEVPPVFIVVCNNTSTSKLIHDYIAGFHQEHEDGSVDFHNGRLDLFRNFDDYGNPEPQAPHPPDRQRPAGERRQARRRVPLSRRRRDRALSPRARRPQRQSVNRRGTLTPNRRPILTP